MELTQQVNMTGIMDSISKAVEENSLYLKKKKRELLITSQTFLLNLLALLCY